MRSKVATRRRRQVRLHFLLAGSTRPMTCGRWWGRRAKTRTSPPRTRWMFHWGTIQPRPKRHNFWYHLWREEGGKGCKWSSYWESILAPSPRIHHIPVIERLGTQVFVVDAMNLDLLLVSVTRRLGPALFARVLTLACEIVRTGLRHKASKDRGRSFPAIAGPWLPLLSSSLASLFIVYFCFLTFTSQLFNLHFH